MGSIVTRQGTTCRKIFRTRDGSELPPGYEARLQIGETGATALFDFDTADGELALALDQPGGRILFFIGASDTKTITPGTYSYELDLYDPLNDDEVVPLDNGTFIVNAEIKP